MGCFRLFLALSVVAGHTSSKVFGLPTIGASEAVSLFFVISGYYMSMVINTKYFYAPKRTFYISRILRIFPMYFVGLLFMLSINFREVQNFFLNLATLSKLFFISSNALILGQDLPYTVCFDTQNDLCANPVGMTVNPPSWSLAIELGFYLVAPFLVKNSKFLLLYIFFGLAYSISLRYVSIPIVNDLVNVTDLSLLNHYFYPSSFILFGLGALSYRLAHKLTKINPIIIASMLLLLSQGSLNVPFWLPVFVAASLPVIFHHSKESKIDRFIGELSYPVYILHFPVIIFVSNHLSNKSGDFLDQFTNGTIVSILTIILSLICVQIVEKPINAIRNSRLKDAGIF